LRGVWDKVREEPVLKFFVVAITGYGMATFEGPMLSLKNVNAIAHLYRLDYCSRSRWSFSLEWFHGFWYDLLVDSKNDKKDHYTL
jgi:cbb3-type cytochrome oxidase subunit 1